MTGRKKANLGDLKTDAAIDSASEHKAETLTKQKRQQSGKSQSPPYIPTDRELEILYKRQEREAAEPPVPRLKIVSVSGAPTIVPDHPDWNVGMALLQEAIGAGSAEFLATILFQLCAVCTHKDTMDEAQLNLMFSVLRGIHPRDQMEAMLGIQAAAIHWVTMSQLEGIAGLTEPVQKEILVGSISKLARTYATLMDTLKRYRTGGEQKVTVQHVSVNEGGQAIVAHMTQDTRESVSKKFADKPLALTNSRQEPMPIIEERQCERDPVPASHKQKTNGQSFS
jgi:hypothetical protein